MSGCRVMTGGFENDMDRGHIELIRNLSFQPIFVMGDHRSGTTVLCNILGSTGLFNAVTSYHIIYSNQLVHHYLGNTVTHAKNQLVSLFESRGINGREIDSITISPETPEEYAYVFKNTGYRPQLNSSNLDDLIELCQKIVYTGFPDKPVLLKNPWDVLNFLFVKKSFPASKFIFIHRHPLRVASSQLKATRSIFANKNEYIALIVKRYNNLFNNMLKRRLFQSLFTSRFGASITVHHVIKAINYFTLNVASLPSNDYIDIRYEDLCSNPDSTIDGILRWLNLDYPDQVTFKKFIDPRVGPIQPEIESGKRNICNKVASYMDQFNYSCDNY